jgi:hypothetical protein
MLMKNILFLIPLLLVVACSSPEERAQKEAQKEITQCTKAGYQSDTPAFEDCKLEVRAKEEQRAADRIKAATDMTPLQSSHPGSNLPSGMGAPFP